MEIEPVVVAMEPSQDTMSKTGLGKEENSEEGKHNAHGEGHTL